jgi:hypothetical protein
LCNLLQISSEITLIGCRGRTARHGGARLPQHAIIVKSPRVAGLAATLKPVIRIKAKQRPTSGLAIRHPVFTGKIQAPGLVPIPTPSKWP